MEPSRTSIIQKSYALVIDLIIQAKTAELEERRKRSQIVSLTEREDLGLPLRRAEDRENGNLGKHRSKTYSDKTIKRQLRGER